MSDPVEEGFLSRLRALPDDDATRLVYADWLEEQARTTESEFLRVQTALRTMPPDDARFQRSGMTLRELARRLDPRWRTVVARAPIEACELRYDLACPKQWDALKPTGLGDDIRYCGACNQNVYYSETLAEAHANARQGRCVAVDVVQIRRPGERIMNQADNPSGPVMMGAIAPPPGWDAPPDTEPERR